MNTDSTNMFNQIMSRCTDNDNYLGNTLNNNRSLNQPLKIMRYGDIPSWTSETKKEREYLSLLLIKKEVQTLKTENDNLKKELEEIREQLRFLKEV